MSVLEVKNHHTPGLNVTYRAFSSEQEGQCVRYDICNHLSPQVSNTLTFQKHATRQYEPIIGVLLKELSTDPVRSKDNDVRLALSHLELALEALQQSYRTV